MTSATAQATPKDNVTLAVLGASLAATSWGINAVLLKLLAARLPVPVLNASRLLVASTVLLGLVLLTKRFAAERPKTLSASVLPASIWWRIFVVGFIGTTIYQTMFTTGIHLTGAGISSLVSSTNPVWVGLLLAFMGERFSKRQAWGAALSMLGVLALSWHSLQTSQINPLGVALLLGANITWAVYTVFARPLFAHVSALEFTAFSLALGSFPYIVFALPGALVPSTWSVLQSQAAWIVLSAVLAQVIGFLGWFNGTRILGPNGVSVIANLVPVVGVALGAWLLHEPFGWIDALAALVILVGVALANSKA